MPSMPRLAVFPKGFVPRILDGRMSFAEWLELAATLDVDGVELYTPFLERPDEPYLRALADHLASLGLEMPMLCHSPDFTHPDAAEREHRGHRLGVVLAGAGSLGAAVIGLVVLTGAPAQEPVQPAQITRSPAATVGGDPLVMLDPFSRACAGPTRAGAGPVNAVAKVRVIS